LCSLLASTRRLGRPESYFREPDEVSWAERFGLPTDGTRVRDYAAFVAAVRTAGATDNGVFAARLMWGSVERLVAGLREHAGESDAVGLRRTFGPLRFVHLRREDVVGQAVSWCRAEQTGFWQQGDSVQRRPEQDLDRMRHFVHVIGEHNTAWLSWFDELGVEPHVVTYERVVQDGRAVVEGIAGHLGVELAEDWRPASPHRRQADSINARWAAALRADLKS
jgi:LPS sulfotransferase NodH